ncbi:hypothetical protein DRQ50_13755 [bacterium]|nr:MAG: hypothetical protein DRQ50_13755 [bacterium]
MRSHGRGTTAQLTLTAAGSPRYPEIVFAGCGGATARFTCDEPTTVPGQAVDSMTLEASHLARMPEARRRQLLRECRRLLKPGGRLWVEVGPRDDQYPRAELHRAAWSCGFEAWVRFAAGRAALSVPSPRPAEHPLVSILIPAFKSTDFAATLDSALAQSWPRCEIIVADDSANGEADNTIADLVESRRANLRPGHGMRYIRHAANVGGRRNYLGLFAEARGAYIKFLNDDDILARDCVSRMALVLRDHSQVTLVTSYRRLIDAAGAPLPDEAFNQPVLDRDAIIDGRGLATFVLSRMTNFVGEPTTTMFRRADMVDNEPHMMSYHRRSARRNGDMSMWTTLMSRGDVAWLAAPLSSFRQHADQVQRSEHFLAEARQAWAELVQDARDTGLIAPLYVDFVKAAAPLNGHDDPEALTDRAEAFYAADDRIESRRLLQMVLEGYPDHTRARVDLACIDWEAQQSEDAVLGAMLAVTGGSPTATSVANLRDMLVAVGRRDEAGAVTDAYTPVPAGSRGGPV